VLFWYWEETLCGSGNANNVFLCAHLVLKEKACVNLVLGKTRH
jgi:hypothetical protein